MSVVISVRNVSKTYVMGEQSVHALQSVSLDIHRGEFVSVVGPSGSGKSTLMHIRDAWTAPAAAPICSRARTCRG